MWCGRGGTGFALALGKFWIASGLLIYGVFQFSSSCAVRQSSGRGVRRSTGPGMVHPGGSRMLSKRVVVVSSFLLALLWICSPVAMAQSSSTGVVTGTVTDSSGAAVPDAAVSLSDAATSSTRPPTTNAKGLYTFSYINPGSYTIKVSKQGFKTTSIANQVVAVGFPLTVKAALSLRPIFHPPQGALFV